MDANRQREMLAAILAAAREEDVLVAPVGSVYFLVAGTPRATTKDVDIVIHATNLQPPDMSVLRRIAARLERYGAPEATRDGAVLQLRTDAAATAEIELIRGRSGTKGGFFPRELLVTAAHEARRQGNLLIYPLEYILVLKADAAIDREARAKRDVARADQHARRAAAFQEDVMRETRAALAGEGLDATRLRKGLACLKENRRDAAERLLRAAGAPL